MKRDWKPGDVALLISHYDPPAIGVCYQGGHVGSDLKGQARWRTAAKEPVWSSIKDARPLVVIDPEDREAVERLVSDYTQRRRRINQSDGRTDDMQAALREFADPKPPKPEEPTGLGAVVEDAGGKRWTRNALDRDNGLAVWWRPGGGGWTAYSLIDAVRVLSEGVQA